MKHHVVFFFIVAAIASCREKTPKPGDVCGAMDEGTIVCQDTHTALLCKGEVRTAIPCRGPNGCAGKECDESIAREGDACLKDRTEYLPPAACSEDKQTELLCRDGRFEVALHCRGKLGCTPSAGAVNVCDRSVVAVGDECNVHRQKGTRDLLRVEMAEACLAGTAATVACDEDLDGKFELVRYCSGPKGCVSLGSSNDAQCDESVATAGSPCGKRQEDHVTCSADGGQALRCSRSAHVWEASATCAKGERCRFDAKAGGACTSVVTGR